MALDDAAVWRVLGIAPTEDSTEIRRAYAKRLRAVHPEDDPEGFNALRLAYEAAAGWARINGLRSIEIDLQATTSGAPVTGTAVEEAPPLQGRPPSVETLTIDQMLDELSIDEWREPELERLRQNLAVALRPPGAPHERTAALQRIFRSEAMKSSRLYAETEIWVALLLRGHFQETEPLIEPSIAFYSWDQTRGAYSNSPGQRVLQRRDAIALRNTFSRPGHRLHNAFVALERPFLDSYGIQYGLTFGLHRRVAELMAIVDDNPEFEGLLDRGAVAWWRRNLRGPGRGPLLFLGAVLAPLALAQLAVSSDYSDYDGMTFVAVWLTSLAGYLLLVGAVIAVGRYMRRDSAPSGSWIEELGDAAP